MIELAKHIEVLLLDNDCVIVPELGGFISHYQPAHYEENEGIFMPPMRTVGFNPQLTMNDGLLVQSYMQAYHTDYPDAARIISEKVELMKETLHKEGVVEMQGIGALHYTIYDTYEFRPLENGILSPALYALDSFLIAPLSAEAVTEIPMVAAEKEVMTELPVAERKEYRLNPKWWGNAVAVAVAVILFFALSVPVENTYVDKGVYASLGTDCLFDAIRSQSVAMNLTVPEVKEPQQKKDVTPVAVKVEKVAPAVKAEEPSKKEKVVAVDPKPVASKPVASKPVAPKKEVQKVAPKAPKTAATKKYHIIVASLTTDQDAQRMLKNYRQQGHEEATVIASNGRYRISLCHYADKTKAYDKLNDLKQKDAFKNAWMLTGK